MTRIEMAYRDIDNGNASRYIKPRWICAKTKNLLTEAFDLREGSPPEQYVSHFIVNGTETNEMLLSAYDNISLRIRNCHVGRITILNIPEVLNEINDTAPIIKFIDAQLPHCGLVYITSDPEKILEAKSTLCLIAQETLTPVETIITIKIAANARHSCISSYQKPSN